MQFVPADADALIDTAIVQGYERLPQEPDRWADAAAREACRALAIVTGCRERP